MSYPAAIFYFFLMNSQAMNAARTATTSQGNHDEVGDEFSSILPPKEVADEAAWLINYFFRKTSQSTMPATAASAIYSQVLDDAAAVVVAPGTVVVLPLV